MGAKLSWRGPLVTVGGPTSQNSEKGQKMIVNLCMSWMSILDKKRKHPEERKKNNKSKNTEYQNVN